MNDVKLQVEDLDGFQQRSVEMARRLDAGVHDAQEGSISFQSMDRLLKVLTSNRWELLRAFRAAGPSSIRAIAMGLGRDYRGVHADVMLLIESGLVERDDSGAIMVPWSRLTAEISLDRAA